MPTDNELILKTDSKDLGTFILSLLEQPRRIEHSFDNIMFEIDIVWCRNLIEICEQRMEQHKYSICYFSCNVYYENGRVDNITSKEAFFAYLDTQQCLSVGVDLSISFVVAFGSRNDPEKQDVRVQAFSDKSYKIMAKAKKSDKTGSTIATSISFSNLTFGEDMSRHLISHVNSVVTHKKILSFLVFLAGFRAMPIIIFSVFTTLIIYLLYTKAYSFNNSRDLIIKNQLD